MSNKNKHNRIVFLTTLSVYLGLVLIGAPPILTQAALTHKFDVKDTIEKKDDLDKKPDDGKVEISKDDFPVLFARLLNQIKEAVKSGKVSLPIQTDFNVDGEFHKSEFVDGGGGGGGLGSNVSNQNLSLLIQNAVNQLIQPKAFELADFNSEKSKTVKIRIEANRTDLSLKISFGKSKTAQFAEFLNREFSSSAVSVENSLIKQLYENSIATSENNQVFVVTRLPRGSLDEFLMNAKADSK